MKKTYINPDIRIVNIQISQILAGSPEYGGTTPAFSGNLSREFDWSPSIDLWSDE